MTVITERQPDHSRAVGDTLSLFAVQLERSGIPINLTGFTVKFEMTSLAGAIKVPEAACQISNPVLGYAEYDFTSLDVDTKGFYRGFFKIYGSGEPDTYPANDDGILIEIFDPAEPIVEDTGIPAATFLELATSPRRTRTVEGTVEERSIDDLIKANRYLSNPSEIPWGIKIARTKPPGTCS